MSNLIKLYLLLFLHFFTLNYYTALGQSKSVSDFKEFETYIASMKNWKKYAYKSTLKMKNLSGGDITSNRSIYVDYKSKKFYYADENQILIINNEHIVQIDHGQRNFKIFDRKEYETHYNKNVNNINVLFKEDLLKQVLDSFIIGNKNVQKISTIGEFINYRSIKKNSFIETIINVKVNKQRNIVSEIDFSGYDIQDGKELIYNSKMYDYSIDFNDNIFNTKHLYKTIGTKKYQLLQYKNYKLLTKVK